VGTTYVPGAATGGLAIDIGEGAIYVATATTPGAVLKFKKSDGSSLNGSGGFFAQSAKLFRPIGLLFIPACSIIDFNLIDAATNDSLGSLVKIDYSTNIATLGIGAESDDCPNAPVESVRLSLDKPRITVCERLSPYVLDLKSRLIPLGTRTVTATLFSGPMCDGEPGNSLSLSFDVQGCSLTFKVYSGKTNLEFASLSDGGTLASPPCEVNIEAAATCGFPINTVLLQLRRGKRLIGSRTERGAPFFLFGNAGSNVFSGTISAGAYSIQATINGLVHPAISFTFGKCV
jgi:hypothetical protein